MIISLIGYRGTGKTTIGQLLAHELSMPFIDADTLLQERAGRTIKEIFATNGEATFRQLESSLILELTGSREPAILSTGGGVVLNPLNQQALRNTGPVVWLRASPRVICQRLSQDPATAAQRPALLTTTTPTGASHDSPGDAMLREVETLLKIREPLYLETATFQVETDDRNEPDIVREIVASLEQGSPR